MYYRVHKYKESETVAGWLHTADGIVIAHSKELGWTEGLYIEGTLDRLFSVGFRITVYPTITAYIADKRAGTRLYPQEVK